MISIQLTNQKQFTKALFLDEVFDQFFLYHAQIKTATLFEVDGTIQQEYYSDADDTIMPYATWAQIRPIAFAIIKGKRLPLYFQITLRASDAMLKEVIETLPSDSIYRGKDTIESLTLNIYYRNGILSCTSATSKKLFSLEQSLDHIWDNFLTAFFDLNEIEYTDL